MFHNIIEHISKILNDNNAEKNKSKLKAMHHEIKNKIKIYFKHNQYPGVIGFLENAYAIGKENNIFTVNLKMSLLELVLRLNIRCMNSNIDVRYWDILELIMKKIKKNEDDLYNIHSEHGFLIKVMSLDTAYFTHTKWLIDSGFNINVVVGNGFCPITSLLKNQNNTLEQKINFLNILLDKGFKALKKDSHNEIALYRIMKNNKFNIELITVFKILLNLGSNINHIGGYKESILHISYYDMKDDNLILEFMDYLALHNFNFYHKNSNDNTVAELACMEGKFTIASYLISKFHYGSEDKKILKSINQGELFNKLTNIQANTLSSLLMKSTIGSRI